MSEAWKYVFAIARRSPRSCAFRARARRPRARRRSRAGGDGTGSATRDVRAQEVAREPRALGELERLVEERDGRRDAGQAPPAGTEPEQDLGPVDVGELGPLGELACLQQELDRFRDVAVLLEAQASPTSARSSSAGPRCPRPRGRPPGTRRPPRRPSGPPRAPRRGRAAPRPSSAPRWTRRREEAGIDVQALREPCDRRVGRPCLAALDLADVLLRVAALCELALRQPRPDAKRAHALAEASGGIGLPEVEVVAVSFMPIGVNLPAGATALPRPGRCAATYGQVTVQEIT